MFPNNNRVNKPSKASSAKKLRSSRKPLSDITASAINSSDRAVAGSSSGKPAGRVSKGGIPGKRRRRQTKEEELKALQLPEQHEQAFSNDVKAYMLDQNHPERQDCVGGRSKESQKDAKVQMDLNIKGFLADGWGLRGWGQAAQNADLHSFQYPRDLEQLTPLMTVLLRRFVNDERTRVRTDKDRGGPERRAEAATNSQSNINPYLGGPGFNPLLNGFSSIDPLSSGTVSYQGMPAPTYHPVSQFPSATPYVGHQPGHSSIIQVAPASTHYQTQPGGQNTHHPIPPVAGQLFGQDGQHLMPPITRQFSGQDAQHPMPPSTGQFFGQNAQHSMPPVTQHFYGQAAHPSIPSATGRSYKQDAQPSMPSLAGQVFEHETSSIVRQNHAGGFNAPAFENNDHNISHVDRQTQPLAPPAVRNDPGYFTIPPSQFPQHNGIQVILYTEHEGTVFGPPIRIPHVRADNWTAFLQTIGNGVPPGHDLLRIFLQGPDGQLSIADEGDYVRVLAVITGVEYLQGQISGVVQVSPQHR